MLKSYSRNPCAAINSDGVKNRCSWYDHKRVDVATVPSKPSFRTQPRPHVWLQSCTGCPEPTARFTSCSCKFEQPKQGNCSPHHIIRPRDGFPNHAQKNTKASKLLLEYNSMRVTYMSICALVHALNLEAYCHDSRRFMSGGSSNSLGSFLVAATAA